MSLTRFQIEALVQDSADGFEVAVSSPGPLAPAGCPSGFNLIRWKFWGQRLEDLGKSDDEDVSSSIDAIMSWWKVIDNHTLGGPDLEGDVKVGRFWSREEL